MKKCKFCAEDVQDAAIKCKHCGSMLTEDIQPAAADQQGKNSMQAVKSKLYAGLKMLPGESVHFETRPSKSPLIWTALGWTILGAFFYPVNPAITWWTVCIVGTVAFFQFISLEAMVYVITNKRVISRCGAIAESLVQIPLDKVQNVAMKQVSGFLDLGHISFDTAGGPFKELVWRNVQGPKKALQRVTEVVHG